MKRIFAYILVLAVCLVLIPSASGDSYRVTTIAEIIKGAFENDGYVFTYDEESNTFDTGFNLDNALGSTEVEIRVFENGFMVKAYSPIYPLKENLLLTSEYLGRANSGFLVGDFEMDYETGEVWFKTYQIAKDSFPGYADVIRALEVSVNMLDLYGDGLAKVALLGYDPASAIEEAEAE